MSTKQLALQLTEAREVFVPFTGKTYHNNIVHIREAPTPYFSRKSTTSPMPSTTSGESFHPRLTITKITASLLPRPSVSAPIPPSRRTPSTRPKKSRRSGRYVLRIMPSTTQASALPPPSSLPSTTMCGSAIYNIPPLSIPTSLPPISSNIPKSAARESMPLTPSTSRSSSRDTTRTP